MAVNVDDIRKSQRADGPAIVMAIGTATPPNVVDQITYPDYYFRVTNSQHMTQLKDKFKQICEATKIRKRHKYLTEDILKENPNLCAFMAPSFDTRQEMLAMEVPKLGMEAASKAINEWARPKSSITHLIFCTSSAISIPGADYHLTTLLHLNPSIQRHMLYYQAFSAGGAALRLAKDLAENNKGARVLVVCSEISAISFRGPSDEHLHGLTAEALFGDGAAAMIIGSDPILTIEKPIYQIVRASQRIVPQSDGAAIGLLREVGLTYHLYKDIPGLVEGCIEECLVEVFEELGICDWNELFWVAHPGLPAILDRVEVRLGLESGKLRASRHVLREFGNVSSATLVFVLEEMRRWSREEGCKTTGEGLEWGVLFGFGPGFTIETVVLRSVAI
eukprot:TRINITY_DN7614_c0_g1_i1.p1 TRINITY_DN7614_c0_g1~~TRINITY_DN7614_c0_g1_i1.p1  ORF type:complete len:391 (+),score=59.33 TRINITY_DN7614_c0_g1_i1:313-1485(+)